MGVILDLTLYVMVLEVFQPSTRQRVMGGIRLKPSLVKATRCPLMKCCHEIVSYMYNNGLKGRLFFLTISIQCRQDCILAFARFFTS